MNKYRLLSLTNHAYIAHRYIDMTITATAVFRKIMTSWPLCTNMNNSLRRKQSNVFLDYLHHVMRPPLTNSSQRSQSAASAANGARAPRGMVASSGSHQCSVEYGWQTGSGPLNRHQDPCQCVQMPFSYKKQIPTTPHSLVPA